MSDGFILQKIRDFVVQIRHSITDQIVGTGFVVKEGIVTCAHVVRDAGVDPQAQNGGELGIYYPERDGRQSTSKRAGVVACFPQHDDDVVLLQLVDGLSPVEPELFAKMGSAKGSEDHKFMSFGYRKLQNYQGLPATGMIVNYCDRPRDKNLHGEPLMLKSQDIDKGMSGAPVLDKVRNLVVGVIYAAWDSAGGTHDRDTGFAVDAKVLSLEPFHLALQDEDLPKGLAPMPKINIVEALEGVVLKQNVVWNTAPSSLNEWVGRRQLLEEITSDWIDAHLRITGLIGFGGEGKSSLARRWVDDLLKNMLLPQPEGVFWWGFYDKPSLDEFFEAAIKFVSCGNTGLLRNIQSSIAKAHFLAAMLYERRFLFILDGLEVLQIQEGDRYGLLKCLDLRMFLNFFAAPGHQSFCLITSRAPLLDLMAYATYIHRDVDCLNLAEGRELLRNLGVNGTDSDLNKVVTDWEGHALTLSLLASYLFEHYAGDVTYIGKIPTPTSDETRYERINKILRRYDEHLTKTERAFLMIFSAFRKSLQESAFESVFRAKIGTRLLNTQIANMNYDEFNFMLTQLIRYRLIRYNLDNRCYTTHPMIGNYYYLRLAENGFEKLVHEIIMYYYLDISKTPPYDPTIDDFVFQMEAVYHACKSALYNDAISIYYEQISERDSFWILKLGLENTMLDLMRGFFPNGNFHQEPLYGNREYISSLYRNLEYKSFLFNIIGVCLMNTGHLREALSFHERGNSIFLWVGSQFGLINLSRNCENLAELNIHLGRFEEGNGYASKGLIMAYLDKNKKTSNSLKLLSYIYRTRISYLKGDLDNVGSMFQQLENMEKSLFNYDHLTSNRGTFYAEYLRRIGDLPYARHITEYNLSIMNIANYFADMSRCHRVLGDIDADLGEHNSACDHYKEALTIARKISRKDTLIEVLSSRGRWSAQRGNVEAAFDHLEEALDYSTAGGYRIYETDIRVGLAWAHLASGNKDVAREEAIYAKRMSQEMDYYWGIVDADEILAKIG